MNGLLKNATLFGLVEPGALALPQYLRDGLPAGGAFNLLAFIIGLAVTWLLVIGTSKSARVNAVLVAIKILALSAFIVLAVPSVNNTNFEPFLPTGWFASSGGIGVLGAAASIFFAYVGFDAVSTAAEETKNPNRNIPIGLIGALAVCTIFYLLVGYGAAGSIGAQPVFGPDGIALDPSSPEMAKACIGSQALVCSKEPLAHVLQQIGYPQVGNWIRIAAGLALPSVILMMMFGQTRIFFTMARDGLLPEPLSRVHPRYHTPHVITLITGVVVALLSSQLPVGQLADTSNSGTLLAFAMVAVGVLILRKKDPGRNRPFRTPFAWIVCPLAAIGCIVLFWSLSPFAKYFFLGWGLLGLVVYWLYGYRRSHLANQRA
jgi:APA family basic amino acid/polyamine antiporter